jgi:hypothetical protein
MASARIALASSLRLGIGSSIESEGARKRRERAARGAIVADDEATCRRPGGPRTIFELTGIETSGLNPT